MEAVKALERVDTLILGGFDREVDYRTLADFLCRSRVRNFIFTGEAGFRIPASHGAHAEGRSESFQDQPVR